MSFFKLLHPAIEVISISVNKNQRKGKWMKKIISACVAFILAFFVVNGIMFAYERPVAWIDTPNGASRAVRNPNAMLIHGTEGYSISKIDSYGFTNQNYALADEYILMMGASHSQGKEITISNRYSTIVNNMLVDDKEELRAFNIACDGHFLPSIINHFQSAIENYPKAKCVTIEIMSTDYSIEDLRKSLILADEIDTTTAIETAGWNRRFPGDPKSRFLLCRVHINWLFQIKKSGKFTSFRCSIISNQYVNCQQVVDLRILYLYLNRNIKMIIRH